MTTQNIMDPDFNGPGSELYRAELFPDLFPHTPTMRLENWAQQDLEMYVGGMFTPGYGLNDYLQKYVLGAE